MSDMQEGDKYKDGALPVFEVQDHRHQAVQARAGARLRVEPAVEQQHIGPGPTVGV